MRFTKVRSPFMTLTVLLIAASMILVACGAPAAVEVPTTASAADEVPTTESAAPESTDIPATQQAEIAPGGIIIEEDFADNANGWLVGSNDTREAAVENGKYNIRILVPDRFLWFTPPAPASEEVDITVDTEFTEGNPDNISYGIFCQLTDADNFIRIKVTPNGSYGIDKKVNGEWGTLVGWTYSDIIQQGTGVVNRLRAVCNEGHITLYINDTLMADVMDTSLSGGSFQLMASTYEEDSNPVSVSFSNLVARKPLAWEPPAGILFSDSFDNNNNNWGLSDEVDYSIQIQDSVMVMGLNATQLYARSLPGVALSNIDMSFFAVKVQGTPSNLAYGAYCRYINNENYYDFTISGTGYYLLGKMVNGTWETLIDWTASPAIMTDDVNLIRVVCSGSDLELYVNDQQLFNTQDTSLTAGGFGVYTSSFDVDNTPITVAFDNLEVKYP